MPVVLTVISLEFMSQGKELALKLASVSRVVEAHV